MEIVKSLIRELIDSKDTLLLKVQTTGLKDDAKIISLTLMDTAGGFSRYIVDPGFDVSPLTEKLTGLGNRIVRNGMSWGDYQEIFQGEFSKARSIIAWNVDFDLKMIGAEQARIGKTMDDMATGITFYDAMELYAASIGLETKYVKFATALGHPAASDSVEYLQDVLSVLEREARR